MKKISALIVSLFLILGLTACSKNEDKNASTQFFNALHNTMEEKSGRIAGSILMAMSLLKSRSIYITIKQTILSSRSRLDWKRMEILNPTS